jgi:hypothetical protein
MATKNMGGVEGQELVCGMCLEVTEHTERAMLAMQALQRALVGVRLIEENASSTFEFRELFLAVWDDLNTASHYLNTLSEPTPVFLYN